MDTCLLKWWRKWIIIDSCVCALCVVRHTNINRDFINKYYWSCSHVNKNKSAIIKHQKYTMELKVTTKHLYCLRVWWIILLRYVLVYIYTQKILINKYQLRRILKEYQIMYCPTISSVGVTWCLESIKWKTAPNESLTVKYLSSKDRQESWQNMFHKVIVMFSCMV